ncbi:hypothetical protein [Sphingomonas sp. Leaf23]|uniref:hypothetical protein n=1 Tax=Sphingomonas sp. Leaf23 TaxID=1735689 RepID=UPI0012E1085E|nr:hypothetical protein [Sphingomonas sp. Leaf23]
MVSNMPAPTIRSMMPVRLAIDCAALHALRSFAVGATITTWPTPVASSRSTRDPSPG